jgi:predicted RNA polymerase sigma factor
MVNLRGSLHLDRARMLSDIGHVDEARAAMEEAIRLYEEKGNLAAVDQARLLVRR